MSGDGGSTITLNCGILAPSSCGSLPCFASLASLSSLASFASLASLASFPSLSVPCWLESSFSNLFKLVLDPLEGSIVNMLK